MPFFPDGLPIEFYKAFEEILVIQFKSLKKEVWQMGEILETWNEARISLIHK